MIRSLMLAGVAFTFLPAIAQDLPARMQGGYQHQGGFNSGASVERRTGTVSLELLKMESPDKARIKVNLTNTVTRTTMPCGFSAVETDAQRKDGAWTFSFPSRYCKSSWTMTIKPVAGRQRYEGVFKTDFPSDGVVYFDW